MRERADLLGGRLRHHPLIAIAAVTATNDMVDCLVASEREVEHLAAAQFGGCAREGAPTVRTHRGDMPDFPRGWLLGARGIGVPFFRSLGGVSGCSA